MCSKTHRKSVCLSSIYAFIFRRLIVSHNLQINLIKDSVSAQIACFESLCSVLSVLFAEEHWNHNFINNVKACWITKLNLWLILILTDKRSWCLFSQCFRYIQYWQASQLQNCSWRIWSRWYDQCSYFQDIRLCKLYQWTLLKWKDNDLGHR